MTEAEFRQTVAGNITRYRKSAGLTQLALAEKLNYSDKAVSKWERGESLPDTYMLFLLSEVFGITLNDLTSAEAVGAPERAKERPRERNQKHLFITALSVGLVWLTASVAYFVLQLIGITLFSPALVFLYAVPVSFIVALVFACIWWGIPFQAVSVSGIVWTTALSVFLTVQMEKTASLFLTAAILQVLTVLWFGLIHHLKKSRDAEVTSRQPRE